MYAVPQHADHRLVGRDDELKHLRTALRTAHEGHGQFVLVGGEPGIGKTTLVTHLLRDAGNLGCSVRTGYCYDLEATPPYGPWRELLHDTGIELPELAPATRSPSAGPLHQTTSIEDVHAGLIGQVRDLAAERPLALVLEDMHWSDQTSLDLARRLSRRIADIPVLLILTYRDLDLLPDSPLYNMLPHLVRESVTLRLTLQPLRPGAMQRLVQDRYGLAQDDEARLLTHLGTHADGNPFYIEELLNDLEQRGIIKSVNGEWTLGPLDDTPVPPLVRQVIDGRLTQLSPSSRELLGVAAVIGSMVPSGLWQAVAGVNGDGLAACLDEALALGLLIEDRQRGEFRFRHALVRQALYESIVLPRRRHWHRRVGETLAARSQPEPLTTGHHYWRARDVNGIDWLVRAGEQSSHLQAPDAAVEHFSRALSLAEEFSHSPPLRALRGRGEAYALLGKFDRADSDYVRALELARQAGDETLQWRCLIDLGALWSSRDYRRSGDYFQKALDLAERVEGTSLLAHSLIWFGNWLLNTGDPSRAVEHHRRALRTFEETEDVEGTATAAMMLGIDHLIRGDLIRMRERSLQAANLFEQLDQPAQMASALAGVIPRRGVYEFASEVLDPNPHPETRAIANQLIETAREIPWRAGEAHARIAFGSHLALHGEYGEGLESAAAGLELATEIEHREWIALGNNVLGMIHLDLLDVERSLEFLERGRALAAELGSFVHLHLASAPLIEGYLLAGDSHRARATFDALDLDESRTATSVERKALLAKARLLLTEGAALEALTLIEELIDATPNIDEGNISFTLTALRGEALVTLERLSEAEREFAAAERAARSTGRIPLCWRLLACRAEILERMGGGDNAARLVAEARELIQQLAGTLRDAGARESYIERALPQLPELGQGSTGGLSERELDVLRLAAQGLTNVEIGERLFISPRTVKGHLQSVYNKLGVNTRTAAATAAIERDLL